MKKIALSLMVIVLLTLTACTQTTFPTDEELTALGWVKNPAEHGYMKMTDAITSATMQGGGLRSGWIELDDYMKQQAVLEFLQGNHGSYREMYKLGTAWNNVPTVTAIEFVLDQENFNLYAGSEAETAKTIHFRENPTVGLYWTRQLREEDEDMGMTYFDSYGVQIIGEVHIYTLEELREDPTEILRAFELYYTTMPQWAAHWATFTTEEAKIQFLEQFLSRSYFFKVVPTEMVITQPFLRSRGGTRSPGYRWTNRTEDGFAYPEHFLSHEYIDQLVDYKLNLPELQQIVDRYFAESEENQDMRKVLLGDNAVGIETQSILTNFVRIR